jgi:hypothetical protein
MTLFIGRSLLVLVIISTITCDLGDLNESKPPPYFETEYIPPEPEPEPEPTLDPTNLLNNGGFEVSLAGWRFDSVSPAITKFDRSDTSYLGNRSLNAKIDQLGPEPWWINVVWDPLRLVAGERYRVSLWIKSNTTGGRVKLAVGMNHDPWQDYNSVYCYSEEIWQHYYFDYTADESVTDGSHLIINFDHIGEYWIDEVWVQKHVEGE